MDGLPHIVIHSGQTLQNVLPLLELGASSFVVVHSSGMPPEPLRRAASAFGLKELGAIEVPSADRGAATAALEGKREWLHAICPHYVVNYTGGTKAMAIGVLDALQPEAVAAFYMDGGRLRIHRAGGDEERRFGRRLSVSELLCAHGILAGRVGDAKSMTTRGRPRRPRRATW